MVRSMLLVAVAVVGVAGAGVGQPPAPPRYSPPFSPYLNLARPGTSPALNYYGLVRPQVEGRAAAQNLLSQVQQNAQGLTKLQQPGAGPVLGPTGFQVGYMTHLGYFQNNASGAGRGKPGLGLGSAVGTPPPPRSGGGVRR